MLGWVHEMGWWMWFFLVIWWVKNDFEKMDMVDGDMMGEKWLNQPPPKAIHYSYRLLQIWR